MPIVRIQGLEERRQGICYEYNPEEKPIGEGGMGFVYRGYMVDESTGSTRPVAIKQMKADLPQQAIERARREASIRLHNDNLVEMLAFIETQARMVMGSVQKQYYVVSELLDGVMLDDLLEGKLTNRYGVVVPLAQKLYGDYQQNAYTFAVFIIRNILSGLMALHDAGFIHRDIDPTNIMITTDGRVKLIDFGIAKRKDALTAHDKSFTRAGAFMGKPDYAAPELVVGDIEHQDDTTDIYAVGILLFQCITGQTPFHGDMAEVLEQQQHKPLPLRLVKNNSVRDIIRKATEKKRAQRYQSAAEFRVALEHLPLPLVDDSSNPRRTQLLRTVGLTAAACVVVAAGAFFLLKPSGETAPEVQTVVDAVEEAPVADDVQTAMGYMHTASQAAEGLSMLRRLSDQGHAEATYQLSRIYFQSESETEQQYPEYQEYARLRQNAQVEPDNEVAIQLLQKAISQDGSHMQALYELGCDYLKGSDRQEVLKKDKQQARELFARVKALAEQNKDKAMQKDAINMLKECN